MSRTLHFRFNGLVFDAELSEGTNVQQFATDWHFHDGWQVVAVLRGERVYRFTKTNITARSGILLVIPPFLVHKAECAVGIRNSFKMLVAPLTSLPHSTRTPVIISAPNVVNAFLATHDLLTAAKVAEQTAVAFCGFQKILAASLPEYEDEKLIPPLINRIRDYISDNLNSGMSLDLLSCATRSSRFHLAHQFSQYIGLPPLAFHSRLRLLHARKVIARGASLAEAAELFKFSDQSHFGRQFKRTYSMTPGEYRRYITERHTSSV